jgi:pimeloyl-ACP methyl ester carboxylesterase
MLNEKHNLKYPRLLTSFIIFSLMLSAGCMTAHAQTIWPHIVYSKDGTPISYEVYGQGEPALVFIHGWSCDSRYWRAQVPFFSKNHRVVTIDLAGHGNSGFDRKDYTMRSFGEDVQAVVTAVGLNKVILIGHSMGGSVIPEAAQLMPDKVIGLIGVDTLQDIEYKLTQKELDKMTAPMEKDFRSGSRAFVGEMFRKNADAKLKEWILSDMSAEPSEVALSAMNSMMNQYISGEAATIFDGMKIPVVCVNADLWPVNLDANRRHIRSFEVITIKNSDHFLMMNRPDEFNQALDKAIKMIEDL